MAGASRNLELKALDPDPAATLAAALELDGVSDEGLLHQRDTYFHAGGCRSGQRVPEAAMWPPEAGPASDPAEAGPARSLGRLKLREAPPATAELIAYAREDHEEPRISAYRIVPVLDPAAMTAALGDVLGVRVVVEKVRRLLLWRNVRIHLDRVEGLGDFVELEAVAASPGGLETERERVEELCARLGIEGDRLVGRGYADLLERLESPRSGAIGSDGATRSHPSRRVRRPAGA